MFAVLLLLFFTFNSLTLLTFVTRQFESMLSLRSLLQKFTFHLKKLTTYFFWFFRCEAEIWNKSVMNFWPERKLAFRREAERAAH